MASKTTNRRPKIRVQIFRIHAWLGLHIFVILFAIFATGTMLVFIDEIEAIISEPQRIDPIPTGKGELFGPVYDGVLASRPDDEILYIIRSDTSWIADKVRVKQRNSYRQTTVWADPVDGAYLGEADYSPFHKLVRGFHDSFLVGRFPGGLLVTLFSLPLLFFLVSGLVVYRRFWHGFFRLPTRANGPRAFWAGIHRLLALWLLPFLLIVGLTGLVFLIEGQLELLESSFPEVAQPSERTSALPHGFDGAALDRAARAAVAAWPGFIIDMVNIPQKTTDALVFRGDASAVLMNDDGNAVAVDPLDGTVLGVYRGEDLRLPARLLIGTEVLHYGVWGGIGGRILWLFFGIMASCLTLAGAMVASSRLAAQSGMEAQNSVARLWRGMGFLKWGLVLFFLAVATVTILRFGPL